MPEWGEIKLGGIVTFQRGFDITKNQQINGQYPVVSSSGINSFHNEWKINGPGVVIGRKGTLGTVFYLTGKFWPHDTTLWVKDFHGNNPLFIYYFLKIFQLEQYDVGTSNPTLNRNHIHLLPALKPPLFQQIHIAEVLSSLDAKIELLVRQNITLEQLAKTLFRQWFVEEAGESWEEKSLVEIAEYLNGLALQKFPAKGINDLHVIKIREMKQGISDNTDKCSNDIPSQYIIQNGDILFSWSGSLEVIIWYDGEGALNQHLFKVSSDKYPKWFYYLATKHHLANFKMIAESKSTTMGHIQREHLREARISIPPKQLFIEYDETIAPLIEKKIENNFQIKSLTKLRDTLLPKLMSGEATVKD